MSGRTNRSIEFLSLERFKNPVCPLVPEEKSYLFGTDYEMPLDTIKCKLLLKRRLNTF